MKIFQVFTYWKSILLAAIINCLLCLGVNYLGLDDLAISNLSLYLVAKFWYSLFWFVFIGTFVARLCYLMNLLNVTVWGKLSFRIFSISVIFSFVYFFLLMLNFFLFEYTAHSTTLFFVLLFFELILLAFFFVRLAFFPFFCLCEKKMKLSDSSKKSWNATRKCWGKILIVCVVWFWLEIFLPFELAVFIFPFFGCCFRFSL